MTTRTRIAKGLAPMIAGSLTTLVVVMTLAGLVLVLGMAVGAIVGIFLDGYQLTRSIP